ncbi:MAG: hypothetical protein ACK41Q_05595 [Candidatus Brocadia sp.]
MQITNDKDFGEKVYREQRPYKYIGFLSQFHFPKSKIRKKLVSDDWETIIIVTIHITGCFDVIENWIGNMPQIPNPPLAPPKRRKELLLAPPELGNRVVLGPFQVGSRLAHGSSNEGN